MKKLLALLSTTLLLAIAVVLPGATNPALLVYGAPATELIYQKTIIPVADSRYDLGTSTQAWRNVYFDQVCLTADTCRTSWPSGSGGAGFGQTWEIVGGFLAPTSTTPIAVTSTATSTFEGGILSKKGYDGVFATLRQILLGNGTATSSITGGATTTTTGGFAASGLTSSNGLTLTGGKFAISSSATSTSNNGFNLSGGCFAINSVCVTGSGDSGTVTSITAGTGLTGGTINTSGTIAIDYSTLWAGTNIGTSTYAGSVYAALGLNSKYLTTQQILLGNGSATSSITGGATTTFSGGLASAGLSSSNGITLTGGNILATSGATSTGNNGWNLTGGCFSRNGTCTQDGDPGLTSLANFSTNGILSYTGSDVFTARVIVGTSNRVSVSNGTGVSGNPTVDIDANYVGQSTITTLGTVTTGTWNAGALTSSGLLTVNNTGTSTTSGSLFAALGLNSKYLTTQTLQIGSGSATSTFTGGATTTTTGGLTASGLSSTNGLTVTGLTSAITLTSAEGGFAEYGGTSCTNQFVRSLSALGVATCETVANTDLANSTISGIALGANLANLTATDTTLTFSGTYNGGTARTIGLNLANNNTWSGLQLFTNTATSTFVGGLQTAAGYNGLFASLRTLLLGTGSATSTKITAGATSTIADGIELATLTGTVNIGTTTPTNGPKLYVGSGAISGCTSNVVSGASITLSFNGCNQQELVLANSAPAITLTGGKQGQTVRVIVYQDATGNRSAPTWAGGVYFTSSNTSGPTATTSPGITTKPGTFSVFTFAIANGTSTNPIYIAPLPTRSY